MKKIIVASKNPVKINASLIGFQKMFPQEVFEIAGISVPSGVPDQPQSEEILKGAMTRAENASKEQPEADFWIGIEGGIEENERWKQGRGWR